MTTYAAARALTPGGPVAPARVEVADGRIVAVDVGASRGGPGETGAEVVDLGDVTVVPGFVDLHSHGGGGASFTEGAPAAARVRATHLAHGTTTMAASLVTDTVEELEAQLDALRPLVEAGELAGIHLEGPWLSAAHAGAHDPALLRDPSPRDVDRLLEAGAGTVVMATLAVERDGGLDAVGRLAAGGVRVALGHSDATYDQAHRAIDAGASVATHLFNAERPIGHREPGLVVALLEREEVALELIADGVHLHRAVVRDVARLAGDRVVLVTDAMAAAGAGDGDYRLGPSRVLVRDGVAHLDDGHGAAGPIAGSTLTLDRALRFAVSEAQVPLDQAIDAVTSTPARILGRDDLGRIAPGCRADLVALDAGLRVVAVVHRGVLQAPDPGLDQPWAMSTKRE